MIPASSSEHPLAFYPVVVSHHQIRKVRTEMMKEKFPKLKDLEPPSSKGRIRRRLIINAAKQRLIEQGWAGLVLRDLAVQMGITHGNLQYYFKTKMELYAAVMHDAGSDFLETFDDAAQTKEPRLAIAKIVDNGFEMLTSPDIALWLILFGLQNSHRELAKVLEQENAAYEEALSKALLQILPDLDKKKALDSAQLIRTIMDGMAIELIYHEEHGMNRLRALCTELLCNHLEIE